MKTKFFNKIKIFNKTKIAKIISYIIIIFVLATSLQLPVFASGVNKLPSAGIDFTLGDNSASLKDLQEGQNNQNSSGSTNISNPNLTAIPTTTPGAESNETTSAGQKIAEETRLVTLDKSLKEKERELELKREEEEFKNLVIARVNDYVNVRSLPSEEGEILGKLYNKSVGNLLSEVDGWYEIQSGSVIGYVKGEFCVTGEDAIELAKEVGTRIATVDTTTLYVRTEPSTEASVLGMVGIANDLLVLEEVALEDFTEWLKVDIEEGEGFIHADYVIRSTEFVRAESKEEEAARLEFEAAERRAAQEAARASQRSNTSASASNNDTPIIYAAGGGSELGNAVANFGLQFVGNPYRYGGNSLTNGTDCSGFTTAVYANFGVSLPRTSGSQRKVGTAVDGLANAEPGDIVCYSGHVGIYIGNGQIVHASTERTGIKVSNASYRTVLAVRRIF